jgi:hypothetical protein
MQIAEVAGRHQLAMHPAVAIAAVASPAAGGSLCNAVGLGAEARKQLPRQ